MNFAVGAIVKNEDAYLLEWLAFHKVVGFTRFLIADNGSSDLTRELLVALAPHEPITIVDYPDRAGVRPQLGAYATLADICPANVDGIAFIDADEFVMPMDGTPSVVPILSERFSDPEIGGVALNWACFGSSGQRFWEDGLVIERFRKCSRPKFSVNQHYKAVVRPREVVRWDSPHHALLSHGKYVDVLGRDLIYRDGFKNSLSKEVVWSGLRVNHYVVKSLEEFLVRKSPKGSASKEGRIKHRRYFELHDKNDEQCDDMLAFVPAVKEELQRFEALIADAFKKKASGGKTGWRNWRKDSKSALRQG